MKKFTKISMILLAMVLLASIFFACGPNDTEEPQQKYKLTIEVQGNGTVDPPAGAYEYDEVTEVMITAKATNSTDTVIWSGATKKGDNKAKVTVDADRTVKIAFVSDNTKIEFPDHNLGEAVKEAVFNTIYHDGDITFSLVKGITELGTSLSPPSSGIDEIGDLTGIEYLVGLTVLELFFNDIVDISALSDLTNLTELNLGLNDIADISVLGKFTNLTYLDISSNNISDITILKNLTNLTRLDIGPNNISDITILKNLTNLTQLDIRFNKIVNISVLSNLTNLTQLDTRYNYIVDISALSNLTSLTHLDLTNNGMEINFNNPANSSSLTIAEINGKVIGDHIRNNCSVCYEDGNTVIGTAPTP